MLSLVIQTLKSAHLDPFKVQKIYWTSMDGPPSFEIPKQRDMC